MNELSQPLDRSSGAAAAYQQVAMRIRAQIETGLLQPGTRLPAVRRLADDVGVNRDTVALAYELLAADGLVAGHVGRGTFVTEAAAEVAAPLKPVRMADNVQTLLDMERGQPDYRGSDGAIALHSVVPDPGLYPLDEFRRALNRVMAEGGSRMLGYGVHQGDRPLREVIAARLAGHGVSVAAEELVICQGASQGIALALRLFASAGDEIAVEEPTYHHVHAALAALGMTARAVPMTHEGPDLEVLDEVLARPGVRAFYTMPSFHNPMGISTPVKAREALVRLARKHGKPVIEDGFEMDLRFEGKQLPPLAALDTDGYVVHLFSFSKSLFPGVRVGAITARGDAVDGLIALKHATDLSGVPVLQAAVAEFVRDGAYDRHLKRLRGALRERRDALLEGLGEHMPAEARWTRPEGGYQVWLELPDQLDTRRLHGPASEAGVIFAPGYQFNHDGRRSSAMRLTTALASPEEIRRGIPILGRLVQRHLRRRNPTRVERAERAVHV